uniref:Uncharacterized protein n=1 Tax=Anguilla anguilla TaxID=7936 RepID=A0A0E9WWP6_ANGAN
MCLVCKCRWGGHHLGGMYLEQVCLPGPTDLILFHCQVVAPNPPHFSHTVLVHLHFTCPLRPSLTPASTPHLSFRLTRVTSTCP